MSTDTDFVDAEVIEPGTDLALPERGGAVAQQDPGALLMKAVEGGMSVEVIERLVALQERAQERNARAAFFEAMTAFRAECPAIPKNRENTQFKVTRGGAQVYARYAALEDIDRIARPVAARHGLSWRWNTHVEGDAMRVVCRVSHVDGHFEDTDVTMPTESKAGSSPQQKYGSAQTYGMRYSLVAALGLTTADDDLDGAQQEPRTRSTITADELADLEALVDEVGANRAKFMEVFRITDLAKMPASDLPRAIQLLERKRRESR